VSGLLALVVGLPVIGAVAPAFASRARPLGAVTAVTGLGTLAAAVALAGELAGGRRLKGLGGFVYLDALSGFFILTIAIVVALASFGSAAYLRAEEQRRQLSALQVRLYFAAFGLFASLMLAAFATGSLGLLWVLIEASTLASCVLVGLEAGAAALEAAWKYIIISSFGVTIALAGTVFLYYAAGSLPGTAEQHLMWQFLHAHASGLHAESLRLAFLLAVVGYGTKVGLAPMHTWLPDAHSEAPSPASAMLSAALLNTGMYAIVRFRALASPALGSGYAAHVLLAFGFASIVVGTLFIVLRGNFKRLFAYSSIEHMGIIAVALGFGGVLGVYGALLHTLSHAIGKAVLFLTSGDVVLRYRTRMADEVHGLLGALPFSGAALLLASVAVAGSPPFGLFLSELTIVRAGFISSPVLALTLLALLAVVFVALVRATAGMTLGEGPGPVPGNPYAGRAVRLVAAAPLALGLAALLVLGVWIPGGLDTLIMNSIGAAG
jgi:hydrogenase-4 component F